MKDFMLAELPDALNDLANQPATGNNVFAAMTIYVQRILDSGLMQRLGDAASENLFGVFSAKEMYEMGTESLKIVAEQLEEISSDYDDFLASNGINDEQIVQPPVQDFIRSLFYYEQTPDGNLIPRHTTLFKRSAF